MTSADRSKRIGVLAILGASMMWAVEPVFAKLSSGEANPDAEVALAEVVVTSTIRAVVVMIVALSYAMLTNGGSLRIRRRELPTLVYVALVGTVFADLMYFIALIKIKVPVINAVLIGHMQPIFIILFGHIFLRSDRLTWYDYFGILVMMLAGLTASTGTLENLRTLKLGTLGDLFVLAATIAWATTAIVARRYLTHLNAGVVTFYRYIVSSAVFVVYLLSTSSLHITGADQLVYGIGVGVAVGVGTILYYESIKRLKAALVGALELSTPFFAVFLSYLVLGETATAMQIGGIGLLIVGVRLLSRKEPVVTMGDVEATEKG